VVRITALTEKCQYPRSRFEEIGQFHKYYLQEKLFAKSKKYGILLFLFWYMDTSIALRIYFAELSV